MRVVGCATALRPLPETEKKRPGRSTGRRPCATLRRSRGGDAVGDESDVRIAGTDEPTIGSSVTGRLRSALLMRGWNRGPEPRLRPGQSLLPGLACLGPGDRPAARSILDAAAALRDGRLILLGR